ncbi:regulator of sigma E protease [Draconibacterium orientale]|uniref:Zinc metalloprotease n=1 Tax=Draconibacterium orientale TaxID=1168034 RepID=X5DYL1_9BACT|nr:RIP metalloprotease RseP [Draconibacterium orientale]AHW59396.1 zinc metalloprotease [Draconibacterium orientale]SEU06318.1 regulator of sigma E protease [Draconibacterium orientale]
MESILIKTAQLLLSLSILVVLHEAGHFMFARLFKTRVEKFYLFFNPWFSLFKIKKGETEYGIGWLPLGGYVKISGMIDESMDKEAMKLPPQPWEFRAKPAWQRLLIMVGGVLMNFIFAMVIYIGVLYAWGEQYLPTENVKYGIVVNETGEELGFKTGDKILTVDNEYIEQFSKIVPTIVLDGAQTVQVERNGQKVDVEITGEDLALLLKSKGIWDERIPYDIQIGRLAKDFPAQKAGLEVGDVLGKVDGKSFEYYDQFTNYLESKKGEEIAIDIIRDGQEMTKTLTINEDGKMGFNAALNNPDIFEFKTIKYGFLESIPAGIDRGVQTTGNYLKQFKLFFKKETKAYESLGGFATIGNIFSSSWDWAHFWNMTAFISIILAIMNLLPIPALDGGHVMFLFGEMITGRKPGEKFLEYAQIAGMVLLLALVLYANANDIIKMINGTF